MTSTVTSGSASIIGGENYAQPGQLILATGSHTFNVSYGAAATDLLVSAFLAGDGALVKTGAGTLALTGDNSQHSGDTTIREGTLLANDGVGLSSNSFLSLDGGVLQTNGTAAFSRNLGTSGSGNFQWTANGGGFSASGGKLTVTVANGSGLVWGNDLLGTLKLSSATANAETELVNSIDLNGSSRTIDVAGGAGGAFATLSGNVFESVAGGGLTKTGAGTLVLKGTNSYTGSTVIRGGTLQASEGAGLPAASFLSFDGGILQSDGPAAFTRSLGSGGFEWTANGGGFSAAGGKLTVSIGGNSDPLTWGTSVGTHIVGTLHFGSRTASAETELTNGIDLNGGTRVIEVTLGIGGDFATVSGAIIDTIGGGQLIKTGSGTLTLAGVNTYNGSTTLDGGTLRVGIPGALPTGTALVVNAGTLDFSDGVTSSDQVVSSLTGIGGTITNTDELHTRTFTITADIDTTFAGLITGNLSLVTSSTHTVTLTGGASYTGEMTNNGPGTLNLEGPQNISTLNANGGTTNVKGALGTGRSTVNANATVNFETSQTLAALNIGDGVEVTFGDGSNALSFFPSDNGGLKGSATVPEPGSLGLLLVGSSLLALRRRARVGEAVGVSAE